MATNLHLSVGAATTILTAGLGDELEGEDTAVLDEAGDEQPELGVGGELLPALAELEVVEGNGAGNVQHGTDEEEDDEDAPAAAAAGLLVTVAVVVAAAAADAREGALEGVVILIRNLLDGNLTVHARRGGSFVARKVDGSLADRILVGEEARRIAAGLSRHLVGDGGGAALAVNVILADVGRFAAGAEPSGGRVGGRGEAKHPLIVLAVTIEHLHNVSLEVWNVARAPGADNGGGDGCREEGSGDNRGSH